MTTPLVPTATAAAVGSTSLGLVAAITLIAFLVVKELCATTEKSRFKLLSRHLNVAIVPLFMVLASILIMKVLDVIY